MDRGTLIPLPLVDPDPAVPKGLLTPLSISAELYRTIVESARDGIFLVDPQARITFANQWLASQLGYPPQELVGRSLFEVVAPEAQELLRANLERRRQGLSVLYEVNLLKQDGSLLPAMVSAAPIMQNGSFQGSFAISGDGRVPRRDRP